MIMETYELTLNHYMVNTETGEKIKLDTPVVVSKAFDRTYGNGSSIILNDIFDIAKDYVLSKVKEENIYSTNQQWLSKQIEQLSPEEVYDLLFHIVSDIGGKYNSSRGGVAKWLSEEVKEDYSEYNKNNSYWI